MAGTRLFALVIGMTTLWRIDTAGAFMQEPVFFCLQPASRAYFLAPNECPIGAIPLTFEEFNEGMRATKPLVVTKPIIATPPVIQKSVPVIVRHSEAIHMIEAPPPKKVAPAQQSVLPVQIEAPKRAIAPPPVAKTEVMVTPLPAHTEQPESSYLVTVMFCTAANHTNCDIMRPENMIYPSYEACRKATEENVTALNTFIEKHRHRGRRGEIICLRALQ